MRCRIAAGGKFDRSREEDSAERVAWSKPGADQQQARSKMVTDYNPNRRVRAARTRAECKWLAGNYALVVTRNRGESRVVMRLSLRERPPRPRWYLCRRQAALLSSERRQDFGDARPVVTRVLTPSLF